VRVRNKISKVVDDVKSFYKIQKEHPEIFEKHREDFLNLYNDLRILLDIPREKPTSNRKG
jgi:hypothetical protein